MKAGCTLLNGLSSVCSTLFTLVRPFLRLINPLSAGSSVPPSDQPFVRWFVRSSLCSTLCPPVRPFLRLFNSLSADSSVPPSVCSVRDEQLTNKSNSTAGAVRVEVNLPRTYTVNAQFLLQIHNKKIVTT